MNPYYQQNGITIYHAKWQDAFSVLHDIDLVVTDPPYTFGIASTAQAASKAGTWGDLMNAAYWYAGWFNEIKRMTEHRQGAAWVFTSWRRSYPVIARAATMIDWPITSVLIWDKAMLGPGGHSGLRPAYEMVVLMSHKGFAIENRSLNDIWRFPWSTTKPHGHPAEKPESLIRKLIEESGGESVLDPFMGSGTTLAAAKSLGIQAIGIEIERKWCDVAIQRLRENPLFTPNLYMHKDRAIARG